jgi:nitrile hydratase accessory protein
VSAEAKVRLKHCPTAEDRAAADALLAQLPGGDRALDRGFDEPWQLRAFALAVAACRAGRFEWKQLQQALISSIGEWERTHDLDDPSWSYYEHFVAALESVLGEEGIVEPEALDERTAEVLANPPNKDHHGPHLEPVAVHPAVRS